MNKRWIEPITLTGSKVVLEPLALEHTDGMKEAVKDGELWKLWYTSIPSPEKVDEYIQTALNWRENLGAMPFIARDKESNKIVGCTRYFNVDEANHRLEIGYTWYSESVQRTSVNTECKFLLLAHAFEKLDAIAVEFCTHWHNHKSRAAIARLEPVMHFGKMHKFRSKIRQKWLSEPVKLAPNEPFCSKTATKIYANRSS